MRAIAKFHAFIAVALVGAASLTTLPASAEPPAPPPPPAPAQPGAQIPQMPAGMPGMPGAAPGVPGAPGMPGMPGVPGMPGAEGEKPSLAKELPIASYIITPIVAGGGAVLNVFGAHAADDLKDPSKHTTPDQTHSLVVKARVGQVMSYVLFPVTGLTTLWGTISTIRAVMKINKLAKPPAAVVGVAPLPGGMAASVVGRF